MIKHIGSNSRVGCVLNVDMKPEAPWDRSVYGHALINHGSIWNLNGRYFDGTNNYIEFNSIIISSTNNFSIESRVKPLTSAIARTEVTISNGDVAANGFYLRWRDGKWYFVADGDIGVGVSGILREWQRIFLARKNNINYIYFNNVETHGTPIVMSAPTKNTHFGRRDTENSLYFEGLIGNTQIYNYIRYTPKNS